MLIAGNLEQHPASIRGLDLVVGVLVLANGEVVEEGAPLWQDIEAELDALLVVDIRDAEVMAVHGVLDSPIQPSERQLAVECTRVRVPWLLKVHPVELLEDIEVLILGVYRVLQIGLVCLVHPYEALEDIPLLQPGSLAEEVWRVADPRILVQIVDFHDTDQDQFSLLYVAVICWRSHLEETV